MAFVAALRKLTISASVLTAFCAPLTGSGQGTDKTGWPLTDGIFVQMNMDGYVGYRNQPRWAISDRGQNIMLDVEDHVAGMNHQGKKQVTWSIIIGEFGGRPSLSFYDGQSQCVAPIVNTPIRLGPTPQALKLGPFYNLNTHGSCAPSNNSYVADFVADVVLSATLEGDLHMNFTLRVLARNGSVTSMFTANGVAIPNLLTREQARANFESGQRAAAAAKRGADPELGAQPPTVSNEVLAERIRTAFAGGPSVQATISEGTVTLFGKVSDEATRTKAENLVAQVQGVKKVISQLQFEDAQPNTAKAQPTPRVNQASGADTKAAARAKVTQRYLDIYTCQRVFTVVLGLSGGLETKSSSTYRSADGLVGALVAEGESLGMSAHDVIEDWKNRNARTSITPAAIHSKDFEDKYKRCEAGDFLELGLKYYKE